jgi:hypothetical protein
MYQKNNITLLLKSQYFKELIGKSIFHRFLGFKGFLPRRVIDFILIYSCAVD